jgi:protein SCO1/2
VNQDGQPVDERILEGKWTAVFFGFTYCPDVCPTTLQALGQAKRDLGRKGDKLQVLLISVDPARDTPSQLKAYLDNEVFPAGVIGLTGSQAQVDAAVKAYRAFAQKAGEGPDYLMEHSSMVYLMDPQGRFDRALHYGLSPAQLKGQIEDAMG